MATSIKVVVYVILITFFFYGNSVISDKIIFVTLSAFYEISIIVTMYIPHAILCISNFRIAIKRINQFLSLEERDQLNGGSGSHFISEIKDDLKKENDEINTNKSDFNLSCKNLTACYSKAKDINYSSISKNDDSNKIPQLFNALNNVNFDCKPGNVF